MPTHASGFKPMKNIDNEIHSDHFITENGRVYAGKHIIVDLYQAQHTDDLVLTKMVMHTIVDVCGATLLHLHCHHFTPHQGISGIAVLAESHISLHSWPEKHFAAWDIFMCGQANPQKAVSVLEQAFCPKTIAVETLKRGERYHEA